MTQEEKANAYDEALALMQDCIPDDNGLVHVRPDEIFHELKIGDDWIRKALLKMVYDTEDVDLWIDYHVHKDEALAWLEKQGEQKPAEWCEEDKDYYDAIIAKLEVTQDDAALSNNQMEFLKSLKDRCTWKPSEGHIGMLQAIVNDPNNAASESCQVALKEIIKQMKKLMG